MTEIPWPFHCVHSNRGVGYIIRLWDAEMIGTMIKTKYQASPLSEMGWGLPEGICLMHVDPPLRVCSLSDAAAAALSQPQSLCLPSAS